jgi:cyanophycin synthetase
MKILNFRVMRGPNYWSTYRKKLIQMRIDLEEFENFPTNHIAGFSDKLLTMLPSLKSHFCSTDYEGGFVERLYEGTWLGHVIEHVGLELQCLAGMDCCFGRTRAGNFPGEYFVILSYVFESAGLYAAEAAFNLVKSLAKEGFYSDLDKDIQELSLINQNKKLGISTQSIINEAIARDIPHIRLDDDCSLILLGQGEHQKTIWATTTSDTNCVSAEIVADKHLTKKLLDNALIPTPIGMVISTCNQLESAVEKIGFPLVIKPINGNHGRGITTNINSLLQAVPAFARAKNISKKIIVEKFVKGHDYRFLVVNYKVVAVAQRLPPCIVGNGFSTVENLIDMINQDEKRGNGHANVLTKIVIDEMTLTILRENQLELKSILPIGKIITLKHTANLSAGGTAIDVTDKVHYSNILLIERAASNLRINLCGIDVVTEDITIPIDKNNGAVIEVNAGPGLRMHLSPSEGIKRNVAKSIVDMLFPNSSSSRIPIIAVTGTNGKTTTVRMLSYMATKAGYKVGFTCTDGIYLHNNLIFSGDCSGPDSARVVLKDPTINFAVLECARGGILRSGLGFDKCDLSIILNITGDHLGLEGINTLEKLTRVKSVIAHSTKIDGYTILNADDDLVYSIKEELKCHIALFSLNAECQRIQKHCENGGMAIYLNNNDIIFQQGTIHSNFGSIRDFPITSDGIATSMYPNVLATLLAAAILKLCLPNKENTLKEFYPSTQNTPGRMNTFKFPHFTVLLDYGHNTAAYKEMSSYLKHVKASKIIGIIAIPGDRLKEDYINIGMLSAEIFDEIIVRYEKDPRGRTNEVITGWLIEGIKVTALNKKYYIIKNELLALEFAINNATTGNFIVHFSTETKIILNYLDNLKIEFSNKHHSNLIEKTNTLY